MNSPLEKALSGITDTFIAYLPNLVAGVVLLALGWFLGLLVKRIVSRLFLVLRFDRVFRRYRWGSGFAKADVRYAFAELIGDAAFVIVFLILLNAALRAMQLTVLSDMIQGGVFFVPKLVISMLIFIVGWLLSGWMAGAIRRALTREEVPRATLIARFAKSVIILFFSAMALTELDIAREIVIIGFTTTIITLGILSIIITSIGGKRFVTKVLKTFEEE